MIKKIDKHLLKKFPGLWILGIHIYIPIVLLGITALVGLGYILPIGVGMEKQHYESNFFVVTLLVSLLSIAIAIFFIIRQVRFNSKRIHHHLPYSRAPLYYLVFFITFLGIAFLPLSVKFGGWMKANHEINRIGADGENLEQIEVEFYHSYWGLLGVDGEFLGEQVYSEDFALAVMHCTDTFSILGQHFWKYYVYIPLILSVLLLVLCSVELRDFGWAMLVSALLPTVFGIISGIIGVIILDYDEDVFLTLFTIFVVASAMIAFPRSRYQRTKKAFGIAFHLWLPVVTTSYFLVLTDFQSDYEFIGHAIAISTILLGVPIFNSYYKMHYIDPA